MYHNKEIKEVFKELNSSEEGLTEKEAEKIKYHFFCRLNKGGKIK